ncbi:MAG: hypothetical protein ACHQT8_01680 [Chlamydiales bacterium]
MKSKIYSLVATGCMLMGMNTAFSGEMHLYPFRPEQSAEAVTPDANFYPLHCGWLNNKFIANDAISLGDRSQWRVAHETLDILADWVTGDPIVVSPNYTPLSPFPYWIKNVRTDKSVMASLFLGSEEFGKNSHWIIHIDSENQRLFLENRLGFEVDQRDKEKFADWAYKDTVIIGTSNTWFTPYDYILINTARNQYVRVKIY